MASRPQFGRTSNPPTAIIAAANTSRDGSGTIVTLCVGDGKYAPTTISTTNDTVTVANWSTISSNDLGLVTNGDRVNFVSGTPPSGTSLNTDYFITELVIDSTANTATFKLMNSSFVLIDLTSTGTNPVMMFPSASRIDQIVFTSAQATLAATASKVYSVFKKNRNSSTFELISSVAMTGTTPSTTVISPSATITFTNGLVYAEGDIIGVTQSVYASAADRSTAIAYNHSKF